VIDKQRLFADAIMGLYELDMSSIYFMYHHEIYMGWLTLYSSDPEEEGVRGYLKVNI